MAAKRDKEQVWASAYASACVALLAEQRDWQRTNRGHTERTILDISYEKNEMKWISKDAQTIANKIVESLDE